MARPMILAFDDPEVPRVVERDLRSEYAILDRRLPAGESTLDVVVDRFGAHPMSLFSLPQPAPLASRRRRTGTEPDREVKVADDEPHETIRVVRVPIEGRKIEER